MKRLSKIFMLLLLVGAIAFADLFLITHTAKAELICEAEYDSAYSYSYGEKYFFIKDEAYNGFYDGKAILKYYLPEFDFSLFDTEKYTYFAAVGRNLVSIKYNGRNCKQRICFALPYEYEAMTECEETDDGIIRIYRMKKINIDYDYHSEQS